VRIRYLLLNAYGRGGTIRTTLSMAGALAARGHDVEVASLLHPSRAVPVFPVDPRVRVVPLTGARPRRSHPGTASDAVRWASARALRRTHSRLAHPLDRRAAVLTRAHDHWLRRYLAAQDDSVVVATRLSLNLTLARLRTDRQVAIGQEHNHLARNQVIRGDYQAVYPSLDALAVLTQGDAAAYRKLLGDSCPVVLMPNALPHGTVLRRAALTAPVAVAAGMLTRRKGFDLLIDAWRSVAVEHPQWRLRIYGTGEDHDALVAQIERYGLTGTVTLEGFTADLMAELAEASLFVLSSRGEGLPMVVIEAMTAGLPVVAFDCPTGPAELLDGGRCGVLVPPGDSAALADSIRRLVSDEPERRRLADVAAERALDYDPATRARQWEQLFETLGDARGLSLGR